MSRRPKHGAAALLISIVILAGAVPRSIVIGDGNYVPSISTTTLGG